MGGVLVVGRDLDVVVFVLGKFFFLFFSGYWLYFM